MAFNLANFLPAANQSKPIKVFTAGALGHGAPVAWHYATEDTAAAVDSSGYFNGGVAFGGAYNLVNIGDLIWRVTYAAGAVSTAGWHYVNSKAAGVIDVTDATVALATDTD